MSILNKPRTFPRASLKLKSPNNNKKHIAMFFHQLQPYIKSQIIIPLKLSWELQEFKITLF